MKCQSFQMLQVNPAKVYLYHNGPARLSSHYWSVVNERKLSTIIFNTKTYLFQFLIAMCCHFYPLCSDLYWKTQRHAVGRFTTLSVYEIKVLISWSLRSISGRDVVLVRVESDFSVECVILDAVELDPQAVVGECLDPGKSGQLDSGSLRRVDVWDSRQELEVEPIDVLLIRSPGVVRGCRVAKPRAS